ncbi:MAG: MFS transporter [Chloroflexi bacterium]|nr:MFS transporter [Chloroflexota bacterium]
MQTIATFRSFDRPLQVALFNMLVNNVGFYMLIPFLAGYMANSLGMTLTVVGLIVGIRSLSQQGASIVGGALADRIGYKQAIVIGSVLRTIAFALFGFATEPVGMAIGAILTGIGGALLSPSVRAYITHEAGPRRVEAFALLDVTMHGGTLLGPLVGSFLIGIDFQIVCFGSAAIFALVTFLQLRYLPRLDTAAAAGSPSMLGSWGIVLRNRPFMLFAASVLGYFFLYNQIYLALPLEVERLTGSGAGVGVLFTVLAVVGIFGQVPLTTFARRRLRPNAAIALGLLVMGLAFLPLLVAAPLLPLGPTTVGRWLAVAGLSSGDTAMAGLTSGLTFVINMLPLTLCALLLVGGQSLVSPFVASAIATLSGGRLVGTYFGMHAVLQGIGGMFGNLAGGAAFEVTRSSAHPGLPWLLMIAVGAACAGSMVALERAGLLSEPRPADARAGARASAG